MFTPTRAYPGILSLIPFIGQEMPFHVLIKLPLSASEMLCGSGILSRRRQDSWRKSFLTLFPLTPGPLFSYSHEAKGFFTRQVQKRSSKRRVGVLGRQEIGYPSYISGRLPAQRAGQPPKLYQRHLQPYRHSATHHGRSSPKVKSVLPQKVYTSSAL